MDLFDFNHDGEVSNLERIMGLAAVLSEANPDVESWKSVWMNFAPSETLWSARNQMILIVRHTKSGKNNANNSTRKLRKLKTY